MTSASMLDSVTKLYSDSSVAAVVSHDELEWMLARRPLTPCPSLERLTRDYGQDDAAAMLAAFQETPLLGLLNWPGVATRWRQLAAWADAQADTQHLDAAEAFAGFACHLGRITTYHALALTKDALDCIRSKDCIFPNGQLPASTLHDVVETHGVEKVAVARLYISQQRRLIGHDPSISLHDDWQTATCIASGYAEFHRVGAAQHKPLYLFELSVPAVESLGWPLVEVAERANHHLPGFGSHECWFQFHSPAAAEGVWLDATLQRTERYWLYGVPFLSRRLSALWRFDSFVQIRAAVVRFVAQQERLHEEDARRQHGPAMRDSTVNEANGAAAVTPATAVGGAAATTSVWSSALNSLGWQGPAHRDDAEVVTARAHLARANGMRDLELVAPSDVARAAELFHRDGFVVVRDVLDATKLTALRAGCERVMREIVAEHGAHGNRGSHRYSFGGASASGECSHHAEWASLVALPSVCAILERIWASDRFTCTGMGGDFCLPGASAYQPLHSDMSGTVEYEGREVDYRDTPCARIAVNFLPQDFTPLNGPLRQIPATQQLRAPPPSLGREEEEWKLSTLCGARAGCAVIRDIRAWHGGTPNLSDEVRAIPNVEFAAPWFAPPAGPRVSMPHEVHRSLCARGQQLCERIAAPPGVVVEGGVIKRLQTPAVFATRGTRHVPDPDGPEPLRGETEAEYVARQARLQTEARQWMQAKFGRKRPPAGGAPTARAAGENTAGVGWGVGLAALRLLAAGLWSRVHRDS